MWNHMATCCAHLAAGESDDTLACIDHLGSLGLVKEVRDKRSFISWISRFCSREATDPRDRIYGLLGLATGDEVGLVKPDYTRSLEEVFYSTAVATIQRSKNLDILSQLCGERKLTLPSFVPDVSITGFLTFF
jgi:hypothetical protein